MILEIRISNFYSIQEEIVIDFRAANIKSANAKALGDNIFETSHGNILKTIVMYGANASGKSNIIKAIRYCHTMIFQSHLHNENTKFNFVPFKFDKQTNKPSKYFVRFVLHDIEYEYSFSLISDKVVTETLHYYPKGRIKEIFTRDESKGKSKTDKYTFNDLIKRPMDVAESTSNKTLFISRASQMDRVIAKDIFNYFHGKFILNYLNFGYSAIEHFSTINKNQLIQTLKIADSDIVDVQVKVLKKSTKSINADLTNMTLSVEDIVQDHIQIKTYHRANPSIAFDFLTEESEGTKKLFFIMLTILDIIKNDKILLIDEIEESLHPKIIEYIFNMFNAGGQAQLLCTTHNTIPLNLKKMRRDQIYFVNKKINGSTDLYSLYDYSDFRDTMDVEKAYLQGRFDAIPLIDESSSNFKSILDEK